MHASNAVLRWAMSNKFAPAIPLFIGAVVAFAGVAPWSEIRNTLFYLMLAFSSIWAGYQAIWVRDQKIAGAGFFWAGGGFTAFALNYLLQIIVHK